MDVLDAGAPYVHVLSFKDPDGIALELFVPRPQP